MQPVFNERSIASAIRAGDSKRFDINLKQNRENVISAAISFADEDAIAFGPVHTSLIKGRTCRSLSDYSQNLILRIAASYISRRYRLDAGARDRKIMSLIEALTDSVPFFVIRRDIRSFYESVPTAEVHEKLVNGPDLPPSIRDVVRAYFKEFCEGASVGLPRGICLSAVLSELAMQNFDARVRELEGVYRYFRYSDDIILLSSGNPEAVENMLESLLPDGMFFNASKAQRIDVNKGAKESSLCRFEYLGYAFSFSNSGHGRVARTVTVSIAQKKIDRIKTRVICAFKAHGKKPNFSLLERRIKFVAGNLVVMRQKITAVKTSRYVKSGIYYNYRLCGEYRPTGVAPYRADELKAVDGFYQSLITNSKKFGISLTAQQYSSLRRISFYKGFSLKYIERYTSEQIQEIKSVWKNV